MPRVQLDEKTTIDLGEDELIVFIKPPKRLMVKVASAFSTVQINFVITSKRVVAIPLNGKGNNDSFNFNDISRAQATATNEAGALFEISASGKTTKFSVGVEKGNILKTALGAFVKDFATANNSYDTFNDAYKNSSSWLEKSTIQSSYNNFVKMRDEAQNKDFSGSGHSQIRDYIVDLINKCVAEAKK